MPGVVQVQHLGPLLEQHTLRPPGGAAGVHEDHRVGLVRLRRYDRRTALEQILVAGIVRHVAVADEHHALDAGLVAHRVDQAREERVDEDRLVPESRRMNVSSAGLSRRFSGLTIPAPRKPAWYSSRYSCPFPATTAKRSPRPTPSSVPQGGGKAQHPLEMLTERPVIGPVVVADPISGAVRGGEQQPSVHELLHDATVGPPGGRCAENSRHSSWDDGPWRHVAGARGPVIARGVQRPVRGGVSATTNLRPRAGKGICSFLLPTIAPPTLRRGP